MYILRSFVAACPLPVLRKGKKYVLLLRRENGARWGREDGVWAVC